VTQIQAKPHTTKLWNETYYSIRLPICQEVVGQKKAEEKKAKSQNMLHQVEENSLVNSEKL
jgi:hypothetical protein